MLLSLRLLRNMDNPDDDSDVPFTSSSLDEQLVRRMPILGMQTLWSQRQKK